MEDLAPDRILERLLEGNRRFAEGRPEHPRQDPTDRRGLVHAQHPHAAVLGCSDSRVPPELVFDQGLGELFVVRGAGHVADANALGSLEFAVEVLGVRLIVVLGHEGCGAIQATVEAHRDGRQPEGQVASVVREILPSIHMEDGDAEGIVDASLRNHIRRSAERIRRADPVLSARAASGELLVVPAHYSLASGRVEVLDFA